MKLKKKSTLLEIKIGSYILLFYVIWALIWFFYSYTIKGSLLRPYIPVPDIRLELLTPLEKGFILGTDIFGRSILEIISKGLVYSLVVSFLVSSSCALLGVTIGVISVISPRLVKIISDLVTNLIFILPSILIAILLMSYTGQSFWGLIFVLIFTGWPAYAKIARGETKRLLGLDYVESARAIGMGKIRLFLRILLPGILRLDFKITIFNKTNST